MTTATEPGPPPAAKPKPKPPAQDAAPSAGDPPARVAHRTFPVQAPNGVVRVVAGTPDGAVATARSLYGLDESAPVTVVEPQS